MALSLVTRAWYEHEWGASALLLVAAALWAPDLRSGQRRWWFFYVAGVFVYTLLRALADTALFPVQTDYVIHIDRLLFGGVDPVVWLQSRFFSPRDIDAIDLAATQVHWSFFVVPHALAVGIYARRRELFPRYVLLLLGILYVGLILFYLIPTTPPWLAAQQGEIGRAYRVMNFVGRSVDPETYRTLYSALAEPNSVASVPSIHMAITAAMYLWTRRFAPALSSLCLAYAALMALSLVLLGEHYVFDLIVGIVVAVIVDYALRIRLDTTPAQAAIRELATLPPDPERQPEPTHH